jgi:hypothetical protein
LLQVHLAAIDTAHLLAVSMAYIAACGINAFMTGCVGAPP